MCALPDCAGRDLLGVSEVLERRSSILAEITPSAVADLGLRLGSEICAAVKASDIEVYSPRFELLAL